MPKSSSSITKQSIPTGTRAVILAGGKGTRLRPYTTVLPKPLMPVGERPILEIVIKQLHRAGVMDITISVGHLAELIMALFGNGEKFGVRIDYAIEDKPLGTIGPLAFIENLGDNFIVMNGDVLTDLDLGVLYKSHLKSKAILTVATYTREVKVDFGVLRHDKNNNRIRGFEEKPTHSYDVSMGVYVLSRRCLDEIPKNEYFGFDHLILKLLKKKAAVQSFHHRGRWLDLGRPEDFASANEMDLEF